MTRRFDWRWARSAAEACLAAAVIIAVSQSEVRAGCNHPWVKGGGLPGSLVDLTLLEQSDRAAMPEPGSPAPREKRGPCAGGACSQAPELPSRPTATSSFDGELWCDLPAFVHPLPPCCRRVAPKTDRQFAGMTHAPIERPPRFLAALVHLSFA
jgi:hypothetical protein